MFASRRTFLAAGIGAARLLAQGPSLTAAEVIERIRKNVGVPWRNPTVDTFKAGDPETVVKGIATSFAGTFDVIRRASASGKNLVIVHEPTFYNHQDSTENLTGAVFAAKQDFIQKNGMVIWRFHDHWHARRPDGVIAGVIDSLGWEKYRKADNPRLFSLPPATLEKLAKDIRDRMQIRAIRVIGDPKLKTSTVAFSPGFTSLQAVMRTLERPEVDVMVIGESREWEGIEFTRDVVSTGARKGLIVMGHVPSEEDGMKECAKWLKTFVPEVPVEFLPSGEPFWSPK